MKLYPEALEDFNKAISMRPDWALYYCNRAKLYLLMGKKHFQFLKKHLSHDSRIRMYRRSENSGSIGNVKNEAVSLCRGKYVLEMDHDDEILQTVLEDAVKVFVNEVTDKSSESGKSDNEEIGFVYMDFINVYENGENFRYGDNICKGYGSYYCQKYNDKWVARKY